MPLKDQAQRRPQLSDNDALLGKDERVHIIPAFGLAENDFFQDE